MQNVNRMIVTAVAALVIGVVLGRSVFSPRGAAKDVAVVTSAAGTSRVIGDNEEVLRAELAELERERSMHLKQIARLERLLAATEGGGTLPEIEETVPDAAESRPARNRRPREDYATRMERLRTENPEAYAAMEQRRNEFQQRASQIHQDRRSFLAAVDTTRMSVEQRENHEQLLAAIDAANEFRMGMSSGNWGEMSDEQRAQGFQRLRAIGELYQLERRYILEETGRAYGEDGAAFADYIENVIENTAPMHGMGRMGPGGDPGGGRGRRAGFGNREGRGVREQ